MATKTLASGLFWPPASPCSLASNDCLGLLCTTVPGLILETSLCVQGSSPTASPFPVQQRGSPEDLSGRIASEIRWWVGFARWSCSHVIQPSQYSPAGGSLHCVASPREYYSQCHSREDTEAPGGQAARAGGGHALSSFISGTWRDYLGKTGRRLQVLSRARGPLSLLVSCQRVPNVACRWHCHFGFPWKP